MPEPACFIKRRARSDSRETGLDGLYAIAGRARLAVVGKDRVVAIELTIGAQEIFSTVKICSGGADRFIELAGILGVGVRIRLDHTGMHRGIREEHVELEIHAAALGERQPIWTALKGTWRRHDGVSLVDRDGRHGTFRLARCAAVTIALLRIGAGRGGDEGDSNKGALSEKSRHGVTITAGDDGRFKTSRPTGAALFPTPRRYGAAAAG